MMNPICQALGIQYPILLGGLLNVGTAPLVAAVSEAGGFGILGAGAWNKDKLKGQIDRVRELTDQPFGVNIVLRSPHAEELVDLVIREGIRAVTTSAGNPESFTSRLRQGGVYVMHVLPTVEFARIAEKAGVDAVIAEGVESGGLTSLWEVTTLALVPQVVDAVRVPVLAAGGIGDGRGLAAALALGAVGVQVGTVFLGTREAEVAPAYKKALLMSGDTDTQLIRMERAAHRRITDDLRKRVAQALENAPESIAMLHDDAYDGTGDGNVMVTKVPHVMSAGQVAGLVREIVPARVIVERMVREARDIFGPGNSRLGLIAPTSSVQPTPARKDP